jgi:hypothetical protein
MMVVVQKITTDGKRFNTTYLILIRRLKMDKSTLDFFMVWTLSLLWITMINLDFDGKRRIIYTRLFEHQEKMEFQCAMSL